MKKAKASPSRHTASNLRLAKRLGITLPEGEPESQQFLLEWSSQGHSAVYDGKGKSERRITYRPSDGHWMVAIGRVTYGDFINLDAAMELSTWLGKAENRRTWRGLAPKERTAVKKADGPTAQEALRAALSKTNGGAVRVA